jgi:hypothetical protein
MWALAMWVSGGAWIACGIAAAGFYNAYFQRKYPELRSNSDFYLALACIPFGPCSFISALISLRGYGWSLKKDAL